MRRHSSSAKPGLKKEVLEELARSQGLAVFKYLGSGKFRRFGRLPDWFMEIAGTPAGKTGVLNLGERFPFVENFLVDAEEMWKAESGEIKDSGLWVEKGSDGREIALEASALWLAGLRVLLIRNPQRSYLEQSRWLQIARQARLTHDLLGRETQKKEILLHCIIHDLSQPLSAMRGCFSSLKLESQPSAMHDLVDTGLRQSVLQESMIREILEAFSEEVATQRRSRGKETGVADIAAVAEEIVRDYSAAFSEKGARIKLVRETDPPAGWKVAGDEPRLRRIFANLVENSLRLSPPGSTVAVGIVDEGRFLRAFVDDEGPGFRGGQAPELFSLLGRGTEHRGKAGLGLYFCRITVENWGGSIGCEQRSQGGARFWFRLPRAEQKDQTVGTRAEATRQPVPPAPRRAAVAPQAGSLPGTPDSAGRTTPPESTRRPLRVLLAEDAQVNQEIMIHLLEKRGHSVVAVRNGREALSTLEKEKFDLVLMDQEMPELNGIEATRVIREREKETGGRLPIVGVTGMAVAGGRDECLAAGMDECIPKPFQIEDLYGAIERFRVAAGSEVRGPNGRGPQASIPVNIIDTGAAEAGRVDSSPVAHLAGNGKFVRRLIRVFFAESAKKLSRIRKAISRRDAPQLASSAHALAGSAGVFDAKGVVAAARRLEVRGRSADFHGVDAAYSLLVRELALLKSQLRKLALQGAGSGSSKGNGRRSSRKRGKT
jgi:signal transduction histidine kinase/ActR/RegA family two-component response regulator/HPt (histidine-containing phosphotransfer) domain-containing protein